MLREKRLRMGPSTCPPKNNSGGHRQGKNGVIQDRQIQCRSSALSTPGLILINSHFGFANVFTFLKLTCTLTEQKLFFSILTNYPSVVIYQLHDSSLFLSSLSDLNYSLSF